VSWSEDIFTEVLGEFVDSIVTHQFREKDPIKDKDAAELGDFSSLTIRNKVNLELNKFYCWKYRTSEHGKEKKREYSRRAREKTGTGRTYRSPKTKTDKALYLKSYYEQNKEKINEARRARRTNQKMRSQVHSVRQ
jgi:hypothetical protein